MITGNMTILKAAPSASLLSIMTTRVIVEVLKKNNCPPGVVTLCCGGAELGSALAEDKRVNLVSFTGSTKVGRMVQETVVNRFGKCLLELGGNAATIVAEDANLDLAIKGSVFGAVGTCG